MLNGRLAELLRDLGLNARAERRQKRSQKQVDIDVEIDASRVALEAKIDNQRAAFQSAHNRLADIASGAVTADRVIAVNYPPGLTEQAFAADSQGGVLTLTTEVEWEVVTAPESAGFSSGTVWQLAGVIRRSRAAGTDPDALASRLKDALERGAARLGAAQRDALAQALSVDPAAVAKPAAIPKRALLVVAAAGMFHARLDNILLLRPAIDARTGGAYTGGWPPESLQRCLSRPDPVQALNTAWGMILAVDYRPIFEAARRVLDQPAQNPEWAAAVQLVGQAALSVSRDASSLRHDLMGRIFHWLVESAPYDGSYYTATSAATLLAGLAIRKPDLPESLADYQVIDPACGTGTLLMAAAERIRDLRGAETADTDAVTLIEDTLHGLDVNTTACHMAAATLGLLSPSTAFSRMNIRRMPFGVTGDGIRAGSLELLDVEPGSPRLDLGLDWASGEHIDTGDMDEITANSHRLVIMNPPYTRDSLRHDQFPPDIESKLKEREKALTAGRAGHGSSSGTMFMDLGEHLTSLKDGATLAFVYPASGSSAPSNVAARRLLAEWFHIDWIVATHDPSRTFFSENTKIGEMLVVCRRHPNGNKPPTRFLILRRNPSDPADAASLLAAIENGKIPEAAGAVSEWPAERMAAGQWRPLGFMSEHLVALFTRIEGSELLPVTQLGRSGWRIGPAGQRVRDVFTRHTYADEQGRRALWNNNKSTQTIAAETDCHLHPKATQQSRRLADAYWEQRGRLLLCVMPCLNTDRVNAVRLEQAALGSGWVPARPPENTTRSEVLEKAAAAWFNSTLGWVAIIGVASPKWLHRPVLSIDAMRRLPLPDLTDRQADALAAAFDAHSEAVLRPLSEADADPQRISLDDAVAKALGADPDVAAAARRELAMEPSTRQSAKKAKTAGKAPVEAGRLF